MFPLLNLLLSIYITATRITRLCQARQEPAVTFSSQEFHIRLQAAISPFPLDYIHFPLSYPLLQIFTIMVAKNVAVTGASGLLGRAVAAYFISQGDQVISLANSRADRDPHYTKLDLMDQEAVKNFFASNDIDCE